MITTILLTRYKGRTAGRAKLLKDHFQSVIFMGLTRTLKDTASFKPHKRNTYAFLMMGLLITSMEIIMWKSGTPNNLSSVTPKIFNIVFTVSRLLLG